MPRQKKIEAVIPTTSLVASAVRYSGKASRIYQQNKDWQKECYRHYEICGEARFAAKFFGHALSRATLYVAKQGEEGLTKQTRGAGVDALAGLFNGKDGQEQMLSALGTHLTIAGECYLVGRTVQSTATDEYGEEYQTGEEDEIWEIVSILEMRVTGSKWTIHYGDGIHDVELDEEDAVIRIWVPNPAKRIEADSPFRSLLPILTEIEWLTRHIFAQVSSRLAGAGILFLPQGMTFPPPPPMDGVQTEALNEAESFTLTFADAALTPIKDPSSPSALLPLLVTAPDEAIDKARLMHLWSPLDEHSLALRSEAIRRFALGMDIPPEQVLGMSSNAGTGGGTSTGVSHWGAWQIEEATIKMHVEPMLELVVNALTMGFLRPLVDTDEIVAYDTSSLRLRPDRSGEAMELYDRGLLSREALLRENGFDVTDLPPDDEFKTWLLRKVASGSATPEQVGAALKALGVTLDAPVEQGPTREARPDPSLEDHPTEDRTPEPSAYLAACDALVFRALERAGNRIRQDLGVKPPGVPAWKMHTLHQANGKTDWFLQDAWSSAGEVLQGISDTPSTVQTLDSYCKSLFASQQCHSRDRLAQWLEVAR